MQLTRIKSLINIRTLFWTTLLVAIVFRIEYEHQFSDVYADKAGLLNVSKNIDLGHGAYTMRANHQNLSEDNYYPVEGYTLTYSYLVSIFTPYLSYRLAADLIDSFFVLLLIICCLGILKRFKVPIKYQTLFLIFISFTPFPFAILTSTDLICTSLFCAACLFYIEFMSNNNFSYYRLLLISVLLFLIPAFKPSGFIYVAALPFMSFLSAVFYKKRSYFIHGVLILFMAILLFFTFEHFVPFTSKDKLSSYGFYPHQLLQIDSFLQKSILYINSFTENLFGRQSWLSVAFQLINILIVGLLIRNLVLVFKKKEWRSYLFIGITISSIIVAVGCLSLLSLVIIGETWQTPPWTFVEETRYYGGVIIIFQLYLIYLTSRPSKFHKIYKSMFILILLFNFTVWVKQINNTYFSGQKLYTFNWNYAEKLNLCKYINSMDIDQETIYIDGPEGLQISGSAGSAAFVLIHTKVNRRMDLANFEKTNFNSDKKLSLLLLLPKNEVPKVGKEKMKGISVKKIKEFKNTNLYQLKI